MHQHKGKYILEEERVSLTTSFKNITSSLDLAHDYEKFEEMREKLAHQERVFSEKEKKVSSKVENSLQEKVQLIQCV